MEMQTKLQKMKAFLRKKHKESTFGDKLHFHVLHFTSFAFVVCSACTWFRLTWHHLCIRILTHLIFSPKQRCTIHIVVKTSCQQKICSSCQCKEV